MDFFLTFFKGLVATGFPATHELQTVNSLQYITSLYAFIPLYLFVATANDEF